MPIFDNTSIAALTLHKVGNANLDQGYTASIAQYPLTDKAEGLLRTMMFAPFKTEALHQFCHEADLNLNTMYAYAKRIFADPLENFLSTGPHIVEHLYGVSQNPAIKQGDLMIAYLTDCIVEDEMTDAIGIFKFENTEMVFNINLDPEAQNLALQEGFPLSRVDKAVIIFNTEANDGYRMAIAVGGSKSYDFQYWNEAFLKVKAAKNNSYLTQEMLRMAREFSQDVFGPEQKLERAAFLNKSFNYFEEKETFDAQEFAQTVLDKDEEKREKLARYQQSFMDEMGVAPSEFDIVAGTVKKAKKSFRTKLKLDTGVEIMLSGEGEMPIERAFDETKGMYYYKMYFLEEN